MPPLPDTRYSLLARMADPTDARAWSEFVDIYHAAVYRYSRSRGLQDADALDVVQKVFIVTQQAVEQWKPSDRVGSFRAWLVQTAHRICLRTLRDKRHCDHPAGGTSMIELLHNVADQNEVGNTDKNDWQRWAFSWAAEQVQREVTPDTWNAFLLAAVEGLKPDEVAKRLNLRVGTVYTAKCRVMARIRSHIQELSQSDLPQTN